MQPFKLFITKDGKDYLVLGLAEYTRVGMHEFANSPGYEIEISGIWQINSEGKAIESFYPEPADEYAWLELINEQLSS